MVKGGGTVSALRGMESPTVLQEHAPNTPHYMTLGRPAWQMSLPRHVSLGCSHVWTLPWHNLPCPNSVRWMAVGAGTDPHHLVDHGEGWLNTGWLAEASGKGWQPRCSPTTISSNHMGQDCPPSQHQGLCTQTTHWAKELLKECNVNTLTL